MTAMQTLKRLARSRSGVAMVEFAMGAPLLLVAGLWGTETANYALVNMKVGQLAVHLADNASRVGDTSKLKNRRIYETDINDLIYGAQIQGGRQLDIYEHGRVIISSLEVNADGDQYIHWQRCRGKKAVNSSFGKQGEVLVGGMGSGAASVLAEPDDAVIFVEINYAYQPLISERFIKNASIKSVSSFVVRDDRDLGQIYQINPLKPAPIQGCGTFSGKIAI